MDGETDAYGKTGNDLQTNVNVSRTAVTGTLKYVTGYTGFNSAEAIEQEGNYLALDFSTDMDAQGATVTVELVGGTKGPVQLTHPDDMFCVFRVTNKDTQNIRVKATKDGATSTRELDLSGLVLESKPKA